MSPSSEQASASSRKPPLQTPYRQQRPSGSRYRTVRQCGAMHRTRLQTVTHRSRMPVRNSAFVRRTRASAGSVVTAATRAKPDPHPIPPNTTEHLRRRPALAATAIRRIWKRRTVRRVHQTRQRIRTHRRRRPVSKRNRPRRFNPRTITAGQHSRSTAVPKHNSPHWQPEPATLHAVHTLSRHMDDPDSLESTDQTRSPPSDFSLVKPRPNRTAGS